MAGTNDEPAGANATLGERPCGDTICEVCVPPSSRCEACGALIWGEPVPYCSTGCAVSE